MSVHTRFAMAVARRSEGRTLGPIFAGRPTIHPVKLPNLAKVVAYHHMNPVRAGVVARAADSTWTSHQTYLRLVEAPEGFNVGANLEILGFEDDANGRSHFDQFVNETDLSTSPYDDEDDETAAPVLRAGARPLDWRHLLAAAQTIVGERLVFNTRRPSVARLRGAIAVVALRDFARPHAEIAANLGLEPSSIHNLITRNEARPDVQAWVASIRRVMGVPGPPVVAP